MYSTDEAVSALVQDTLELEKDFNEFKLNTGVGGESADSIDSGSQVKPENCQEPAEEAPVRSSNDGYVEVKEEGVQLDDMAVDQSLEMDPELLVFANQVDRLSIGCWFEVLNNGKNERCKLAAHIRAVDKFIFVNRSGIKVMEHNRQSLAVLLRNGELQVLSDGLLFDRALESVIGSLRGVN